MEDIDFYIVLGILFLAYMIGMYFVKARYSFRHQLNFRLIGYGAVMLALWFMLPSIPTLATFYYPDVVTDIDTDKEILYYLQQHNRAIVKTAQVLNIMIFISIFWLLTIISTIINQKFSDHSTKNPERTSLNIFGPN